jgi:DNA-binding IclR family transcriptional regulator
VSQSLARALRMLTDIAGGAHSLDELARSAGVHKTTVLRLLRVLEQERFVYRDAAHGYHLGSQLFALSNRALEQSGLRAAAGPHLARLNRATGQTVHLGILEAGTAVYIDKLDSHQHVRMYSRIGLQIPLHCTGIGKVLLAGMPEAARARVAAEIEYPRFTPNTIATPAALLTELDRVAEQGYAVDHAEHETFVNCIAAPIRDASGAVVAAASISVPDIAQPYEQVLTLLPELLDTVRAISADCGYRPDSGEAP